MRLELSNDGKLHIRNITNDAWDYITKLRNLDGNPWEWYFSKEPYQGSVRVYYNPYNLGNSKLVRYLDELRGFFDMKCSAAENLLLQSWHEICNVQRNFVETNREKLNLEDNARYMKKILSHGCNRCGNFRQVQDGDDLVGSCSQEEKLVTLSTIPLCLERGGFGTDGMWHLGQKNYPHSGCKYLEIEGEKV